LFESEGQAYLTETEDYRGMRIEEEKAALDQIGAFFKRSGTKIKNKYKETDFKGGASNLGKSIAEISKETSKDVKKGWMKFTTKVKGLFSKKDSPDDRKEAVACKFKTSSDHEAALAQLRGTVAEVDEFQVPEMLSLEGVGNNFDEDSDEEVQGEVKVVFSKKGVVRDYRASEKASAHDENEGETLAESIAASQINYAEVPSAELLEED